MFCLLYLKLHAPQMLLEMHDYGISSFEKIAGIYYCLRNFSSAFLHIFLTKTSYAIIGKKIIEKPFTGAKYQPFLSKPKATLRATLPLSESTRCANT